MSDARANASNWPVETMAGTLTREPAAGGYRVPSSISASSSKHTCAAATEVISAWS